jgi:hypothetical protein
MTIQNNLNGTKQHNVKPTKINNKFNMRTQNIAFTMCSHYWSSVMFKMSLVKDFFCDILPRSLLKVNWRFEESRVLCLAYSWTVNMEATCSSETSVRFQRTTRRYIREHRTLHVIQRWQYKLWGYHGTDCLSSGLWHRLVCTRGHT